MLFVLKEKLFKMIALPVSRSGNYFFHLDCHPAISLTIASSCFEPSESLHLTPPGGLLPYGFSTTGPSPSISFKRSDSTVLLTLPRARFVLLRQRSETYDDDSRQARQGPWSPCRRSCSICSNCSFVISPFAYLSLTIDTASALASCGYWRR